MRKTGNFEARAHVASSGEALPCAMCVNPGEIPHVTATVENLTGRPCQVVFEFLIAGTAPPGADELRVQLPLTANGLFDHHALKAVSEPEQLIDCEQSLSLRNQQAGLVAHYLEPAASHPGEQRTKAPLLIPLVEWFTHGHAARFALFACPEHAWRFSIRPKDDGRWSWSLQTVFTLQPGESQSESCWLFENSGGTREAWRAFHQFARDSDLAAPDWLRQVRVHYFDFLSAGEGGCRGAGYDQSAVSLTLS